MIKIISALLICFIPTFAIAECFDHSGYKTCYDDNGNNYEIFEYEESTKVYGSNSKTGKTWSQESIKLPDRTETYGETDGKHWNRTDEKLYNGSRISHGRNSEGKYFYHECNEYGCSSR